MDDFFFSSPEVGRFIHYIYVERNDRGTAMAPIEKKVESQVEKILLSEQGCVGMCVKGSDPWEPYTYEVKT